jgi:ribosome-associated heat shock protein Hsp15
MTDPTASVRLDIWLWRARFFKTRALAAKACDSGHIRLERNATVSRVEKPAQAVKPGDRLIFTLGARLFDVTLAGIGERRGPATEAQTPYVTNPNP